VVASDGGRSLTVASDGGERTDGSDNGQESMAATAASVTTADTTTVAAIAVARFKISEIQTHCFSTLNGTC